MKIFHRSNGATIKDDEFLTTVSRVLSIARCIGVSRYGSNGFFAWSVTVLLLLSGIEIAAVWKMVRLLAGIADNTTDGRGFVARLSGLIFYGNALLSLTLSLKFIRSWTNLSHVWYKADTTTGFKLPPDFTIRRRTIIVTVFVAVCACLEHILSMMSATGFSIPPEEYFKLYIINSHGFLVRDNEYSLWVAIPIFIISKIATLLWNFQDLIIILISMGLTSRYHRLNKFVKQVLKEYKKGNGEDNNETDGYIQVQMWRKVRQAYVRQAALVRKVDRQLGGLVLLSNINNLYFICLQLFLGIGKISGTFIHLTYYFLSLGWLVFRACSVVLAASDISDHSTKALSSLYQCPGYNIEIKRLINQLRNDDVTLTGMGLFSLNRKLMLQVAAVIFKYELVLIQYDNN